MRITPAPTPDAPPDGRLRLTPEGLGWFGVLFLLGLIGWYKGLNVVLLLAYTMAGLLVLNGLLARAQVRRVTAARDPLPPVFVGEATRLVVRVRNAARRPAVVGVVDAGGPPGGWFLNPAAPSRETELAGGSICLRRGRFRGLRVTVWSGFPFGFLRYERPAAAGADLVVLPAVGEANPDGLRRWVLDQAATEGRGRRVLRRPTTDHADIRGVRLYRPGDSLRTVHWKTSARRGELVVREYDTAPSPELLLVVDPWLPAKPSARDREKLEAALSLAATVVRTWCRYLETPATVVVPAPTATEHPAVHSGPATEATARQLLVPLADVEGGPEYAPPAPSALGRSLRTSTRVVVSSRPDSPLAAALTHSTGRPFAALDPSAPPPWYQPPPGTFRK